MNKRNPDAMAMRTHYLRLKIEHIQDIEGPLVSTGKAMRFQVSHAQTRRILLRIIVPAMPKEDAAVYGRALMRQVAEAWGG